MGSYYYFAAQLPHLFYGQKPPMSSSELKTLAEGLMSKSDAALLEYLSLDPDIVPAFDDEEELEGRSTGCAFVDAWRDWERGMRLDLAKYRAVKTHREKDAPSEIPDYFSGEAAQDLAIAALKAITTITNPLEGEHIIDKARWDAVEVLAGSKFFHRNSILSYYLKLLLLERREAFDAEAGFAEYKSLYSSIMKTEHIKTEQQFVGESK